MTQATSTKRPIRIHPNAWAHLANFCKTFGIGDNPLVSSLVIHAVDPRVRYAIVDSLRQTTLLPGGASSVNVAG